MPRRKRNLTIVAVLLVLVTVEVALRAVRDPIACVEVVNQGGEPIENLRLTWDQNAATVATIEDQGATKLFLGGRGQTLLTVEFQQKDNPLTHFEIPAFDPAALEREGFKLVLVIRRNEFERYRDDGEPSWLSRLATRAQTWLEQSLESP